MTKVQWNLKKKEQMEKVEIITHVAQSSWKMALHELKTFTMLT